MTATKLMTAEELFLMPDDGFLYDLIDGELVRMMPPGGGHGKTTFDLAWHIASFVRPCGLGTVFAAETGFVLRRNPDVVLGPDIAFVRTDRLPADRVPEAYVELAPDLAVEVISPSERRGQVMRKVRKYLEGGVRLLWLVNPRRRTVTVYTPGVEPRILTDTDELDGGDVLPGFRLAVAAIFA
jgi:Uma2 family endonuclease